jgi:hypothetical protein
MANMSWYPHYFNTKPNLDYVERVTDIWCYGADGMKYSERAEFLRWYETQRSQTFENRHVLEEYCQDDVTVLHQACQVFRRKFLLIGNVEVLLESVTNIRMQKSLEKFVIVARHHWFDQRRRLHRQCQFQRESHYVAYPPSTDEQLQDIHGRSGREFRLPKLPRLSVDGYNPDTKQVHDFCGCYFHGHTVML